VDWSCLASVYPLLLISCDDGVSGVVWGPQQFLASRRSLLRPVTLPPPLPPNPPTLPASQFVPVDVSSQLSLRLSCSCSRSLFPSAETTRTNLWLCASLHPPPLAIVSAIAPPSHLVFTCIFSHLISSHPFSRRRVFAYAPRITSSPFVGVSVWHSSSSVAFPPLCPLFPSPRVSSVLSPAHSAWSGCRV
jgi:hypothetical protein